MNKKLIWVVVAVISMALGMMIGAQKFSTDSPAPEAVVTLFKANMPDVNGTMQPMEQFRGKTLLINFWATWCAPCVEEMPELSALSGAWKLQGVQLIGIGIDNPEKIKTFAQKHGIGYPLYIAGIDGIALSNQFGNRGGGLPFTVLIGADGVVKKSYLGRLNIKSVQDDLARIISAPN